MMFPKPSRTARKLAERRVRLKRQGHEDAEKAAVRRRDRACRFPLCGCRRLRLALEVSHFEHKGSGGNPSGTRSDRRTMVLLCSHRHQHGPISRHKGTLRVRFLTRQGFDGPVAWSVAWGMRSRWYEVAREVSPGVLEVLSDAQKAMLEALAEMSL